MKLTYTRFGLTTLVIFLILIPACKRSDGRNGISGKVQLEGKPLDDGSIMFEPMEGQGTRAGGPIVNGEYKIEPEHGLVPGKYVVQITSGDGVTGANEEEAATPGAGTNILSMDRIPPEWNVNSKQQIEVKAGDKNQFNFDIPQAVDINAKRKR